jgi:hypothetical protein
MTSLQTRLIDEKMRYASLMRVFDHMSKLDLSNEEINGFLDEKDRLEKLISILEWAIKNEK